MKHTKNLSKKGNFNPQFANMNRAIERVVLCNQKGNYAFKQTTNSLYLQSILNQDR